MTRIKILLLLLALLICAAGIGGAWYYWTQYAMPEQEVARQISGKGGDGIAQVDLGKRHFDAAIQLLKDGELISGRDRLKYLLEYFPESATCSEARRIIGEVNMDLLISRIPMPAKAEHTVRRGEALVSIARHTQTTIDYILRANAKTSEFIFPDEVLVVYPLDFQVEIDLNKKVLTVLDEGAFFKEYAVVDQNLPADLKGPLTTTVTERVAWLKDKPINFTNPEYMNCGKWIRTGRMGLFIRQANPGSDSGESRPFGVMIANSDLEELFTILRTGAKVALVK